MSSSQQC